MLPFVRYFGLLVEYFLFLEAPNRSFSTLLYLRSLSGETKNVRWTIAGVGIRKEWKIYQRLSVIR